MVIMLNEEEKELLLKIAYGDAWIESTDSAKLKQAIKSAIEEIDAQTNVQRNLQGEEIISDDEVVSDEEEYL